MENFDMKIFDLQSIVQQNRFKDKVRTMHDCELLIKQYQLVPVLQNQLELDGQIGVTYYQNVYQILISVIIPFDYPEASPQIIAKNLDVSKFVVSQKYEQHYKAPIIFVNNYIQKWQPKNSLVGFVTQAQALFNKDFPFHQKPQQQIPQQVRNIPQQQGQFWNTQPINSQSLVQSTSIQYKNPQKQQQTMSQTKIDTASQVNKQQSQTSEAISDGANKLKSLFKSVIDKGKDMIQTDEEKRIKLEKLVKDKFIITLPPITQQLIKTINQQRQFTNSLIGLRFQLNKIQSDKNQLEGRIMMATAKIDKNINELTKQEMFYKQVPKDISEIDNFIEMDEVSTHLIELTATARAQRETLQFLYHSFKYGDLQFEMLLKYTRTISEQLFLKAWDFYNSIGAPKYICAPMVDQSELAFRHLTRNHGVQLAYTPMMHSKVMITTKTYKEEFFQTNQQDRPLFVQFCGNDPDTIVKAAQMVENECDAIDINLGCPQGIARKGNYGSFLLEKPNIIMNMIKALKQNVKVPITCKIRILKDKNKTFELVQMIQDSGCSILCVHGRTKEQNKDSVGSCDWQIIKEIKQLLKIPVFANGGIGTWFDVQRCLQETGADAVMSSEALLENPALFSGQLKDLDDLALEYMTYAKQYNTRIGDLKGHLFKFLHSGLSIHIDLRSKLANAKSYDDHLEIVVEMKQRRIDTPPEDKLGWYTRYQRFKKPENKQEQIEDKIQEKLNILVQQQ